MQYSDRNYNSQGRYPNANVNQRRRKRRKKRVLEKIIPAFVAIVLIGIVIIVGISTGLFDSFSYSSKKANINDYFHNPPEGSAVVLENGEVGENLIRVIDSHCYLDIPTIRDTITERFYYDANRNELLYTTAEKIITTQIGSNSYSSGAETISTDYQTTIMEGDTLYVALDYLGLFKAFDYKLAGGDGEPYRVELRTEAGEMVSARLKKDQAIRIEADRESEILRELKSHTIVKILEEGKEWTKVETEDLISGYIENKFLGEKSSTAEEEIMAVREPEFTYFAESGPVNLAWDMVTNMTANEYLSDRLGSDSHGLTVISPTWFSLSDNEGNISSLASHDYVDKCHGMGIKVWGLVDNITHSEVSTYEILSSAEKRTHVIDQLISLAKEYNLDGINVDFESLSSDAGEPFIQFIRELYLRTRSEGIVLSSDNYVPLANGGVYNRDEQGTFLDYLIIMGYDEHYVGSKESGSVASIGFVTDGIEKTLEEVPAERVINGVPLYTRIWIEKPKSSEEIDAESLTEEYIPYNLEVQTVGISDAKSAVNNAGASTVWDETTAQNYAEWQKDGNTYKVWLEDGQSLSAKLEVMKAHNLAGVACWQLGYATSDILELLSTYY